MIWKYCYNFYSVRSSCKFGNCILAGIVFDGGLFNLRRTMAVFSQNINSITGKMEWIPHSEDYDFKQEIARSAYADMLHDKERNLKYFDGLHSSINILRKRGQQVHVLDIGTGTGLLSMMAVVCGADSVTACEAFSPVADCAKKIMRANGYEKNINLVGKRSTELKVGPGMDMERRANLLVTEVFDTELIGEGALETFQHANRELLTSDALIVPSRATIYAQVVSSEFIRGWNKLSPNRQIKKKSNIVQKGENNDDIMDSVQIPKSVSNCPGSAAVFDIQLSQISTSSFTPLSNPIPIFKFDWSGRDIPLVKCEKTDSPFVALNSGKVDAVLMWWDITMDQTGDVLLSCAPYWAHPDISDHKAKIEGCEECLPWRDHWMQAVYFPPSEEILEKGQDATLVSSHDEYSLWFNLKDTSDSSTRLCNEHFHSCLCGIHGLLPRSRIGQLSDPRRIDFYTQVLSTYVSANTIGLVLGDSCLWAIVMIKLGASHVYVKESGNVTRRILESFIEANSVSDKVTILPSEMKDKEGFDFIKPINLVFSEPFFLSALQGWHSLLFVYLLDDMKSFLSTSVTILPNKMEIKGLPVYFRDLWKIRAPLNSCCWFTMEIFDELIDKASLETDSNVEPQPLWEYPTYALADEPSTLFEMPLTLDVPSNSSQTQSSLPFFNSNTSKGDSSEDKEDKGINTVHAKLNDIHGGLKNFGVERPILKSDQIVANLINREDENSNKHFSKGSLNGMTVWCDWHFGDRVFSSGLQESVQLNEKVQWDPYSRQGVFFFSTGELENVDSSSKVESLTKFNPNDGEFVFNFKLK